MNLCAKNVHIVTDYYALLYKVGINIFLPKNMRCLHASKQNCCRSREIDYFSKCSPKDFHQKVITREIESLMQSCYDFVEEKNN